MRKSSFLPFLFLLSGTLPGLPAGEPLTFRAGPLRLVLDGKGRIVELSDPRGGKNFLHPTRSSFLVRLKRYSSQDFADPVSCRRVDRGKGPALVRLDYDEETSLTVRVTPREGWFRLEITGAKGLKDIDTVTWGPLYTRLEGPVGEFLGVLRSGRYSLGMMSLEPNTDGESPAYAKCAFWLPWREGGTYLKLISQDHTRSRRIGFLRSSRPIPGLTVLHSAAALWGAPRGGELSLIERIEKTEGLPHPTFKGTWAKVSKEVTRPSVWCSFTARNFDAGLALTQALGALTMCGHHRMCGTWGHFDLDPRYYPEGWKTLREMSRRAAREGIGLTLYTLTHFTRPNNPAMSEPFLSPVPDPRLARFDVETRLASPLGPGAKTLILEKRPHLARLFRRLCAPGSRRNHGVLLQVEDELIRALHWKERGNKIALEKCNRGFFSTVKLPHPARATVRVLLFQAYSNLYPGTQAMCEDEARFIGAAAAMGDFMKVILDGHESALQTGHGAYSMNRTCRIIYDLNSGRDLMISGSRLTNYCWHMISYISWGEHDHKKGFRGSMLDYRLWRQDQLSLSFMPHKMGQHYPDRATVEDLEWLCGMAAGWDSGMDLTMRPDRFEKNPHRKEILQVVRRWEDARLSGKLTERQKALLRQPDCIFTLQKKPGGGFEISLKRRWRHQGVKILPPSTIRLEPRSPWARVEPAGVDLSKLHSPLVAISAALSDDLVVETGKEAKFRVFYPGPDAKGRERQQLQLVIRVPKDAPGPVRNPRFTANGETFLIPAELRPGQYAAFPAAFGLAYLYGPKDELLRQVHIRHATTLPTVPRGRPFDLTIHISPGASGVKSTARVNLYSFQPIRKK